MYELYFDSIGFAPTKKEGEILTDSGHLIITPCPVPYRINDGPDDKYLTCYRTRAHPN